MPNQSLGNELEQTETSAILAQHCGSHDPLIELVQNVEKNLATLSTDVKWLVRLGRWFLATLAAICVVVVIPASVYLYTKISDLSEKVVIIQQKLVKQDEALQLLQDIHKYREHEWRNK